jgi:selenide,water dikinase
VPQQKLLEFLEGIGDGTIGMDCSIKQTRYPDIFLISTTDFFYPLVDDPYMQGKIACANVLSDLYALGVVDCDNLLMLLSVSTRMDPLAADISTKLLIKGFNDQATTAQTKVTGGQTVRNPWPIIGGVAMSTLKESDFIRPDGAQPGDVLVLTKPIGTQLVVNLHQWLQRNSQQWSKAKELVTPQEVIDIYEYSIDLMSYLNRTAAILMHKYKGHAATDVTGFGLIRHATNLAANQKEDVAFIIDTLPCLSHVPKVAESFPGFGFLQGTSAETSGGLLIAMPSDTAPLFCEELEKLEGWPAWIIGQVIDSRSDDKKTLSRMAHFVPDIRILEIGPKLRTL